MFPRQRVCLFSVCIQGDPIIAMMCKKWWVGVIRYSKQDLFDSRIHSHRNVAVDIWMARRTILQKLGLFYCFSKIDIYKHYYTEQEKILMD